jgi:Chaperone of endosialidase
MNAPVRPTIPAATTSPKQLLWRPCSILIALCLGCFGPSHAAQAVTPAPDGGYPGGNTAEGTNALHGVSSGSYNTATGVNALFTDTIGTFNTADGAQALYSNNGSYNTATGLNALYRNRVGWYNTATGAQALFNNVANFNTADGVNALYHNTTGTNNTGIGAQALFNNTIGPDNTAIGFQALHFNASGFSNAAVGAFALQNNGSSGTGAAHFNTAVGGFALQANVDGARDTAIGTGALENANGGSDNTAVGETAGSGITTHSNIIAIGQGVSGVSTAFGEVDNACYIGNISGANVASGTAVFVDADGKLGTVSSSRRFKKEIKPMDKASEVILALKPVTFQYNYDKKSRPTPEFGLIAEEVAEVNPDLVVRDKNGEVMTVRYEQVNAMLLNEFLKEHRKVQELEKQIEALTGIVQKVSEKLELTKAPPQLVANP